MDPGCIETACGWGGTLSQGGSGEAALHSSEKRSSEARLPSVQTRLCHLLGRVFNLLCFHFLIYIVDIIIILPVRIINRQLNKIVLGTQALLQSLFHQPFRRSEILCVNYVAKEKKERALTNSCCWGWQEKQWSLPLLIRREWDSQR